MGWKHSLRIVSKKKLYLLYDKSKLLFFIFRALRNFRSLLKPMFSNRNNSIFIVDRPANRKLNASINTCTIFMKYRRRLMCGRKKKKRKDQNELSSTTFLPALHISPYTIQYRLLIRLNCLHANIKLKNFNTNILPSVRERNSSITFRVRDEELIGSTMQCFFMCFFFSWW